MKIYTTAQFFANEGLYITSQLGPLYDFYFINLSPANGAAFTNSLGVYSASLGLRIGRSMKEHGPLFAQVNSDEPLPSPWRQGRSDLVAADE